MSTGRFATTFLLLSLGTSWTLVARPVTDETDDIPRLIGRLLHILPLVIWELLLVFAKTCNGNRVR